MRITCAVVLLGLATAVSGQTPDPDGAKVWIARSDAYTKQLLAVQFRHAPEAGSEEGLAQYDELISSPTLAVELAARHEFEQVLRTVDAARATETDARVQEDLSILHQAFDLQFRAQDFALRRQVPYLNASEIVFQGLRGLLDDQVAPQRRSAALVRLRRYAGAESGYEPFTALLKQRELAQIALPNVIYPSRGELETELGRNGNYIEGIGALFKKYGLSNWAGNYGKLADQLKDYDRWVRATILPKARTDFRLPPELYALNLEGYGVDIPPAKIAAAAHAAFKQYQAQMAPLAVQIATARHLPATDYRAVIAELKKSQITGKAILPFYNQRLHEIERIIRVRHLITLPNRAAIIRLATAAETAQQPAPHMVPPPFLHNTGQRGEFVLPLNIPSATGGAADNYDDFTSDAVAWTLTAHEARPGHELQFDSMVEHGMSQARALYAFNSTNAEGWGLYSEYIMQPFEPVEGQLMTLDLRLLRAARAFLDPELQSGATTPERAYQVLEQDVVLSHAFAKEEVERFTYRAPGQANSYFYGYSRLLAVRQEAEALLGQKFNQQAFHDFIIAQGLLPPDLMRKAILSDFVPSQKNKQ
jgi:hypothetical protein